MLEEHLSEPWFSLVATGSKVFEGRLGSNKLVSEASVGTVVAWFNDDLGETRRCHTKIVSKSRFKSFGTMLRSKGLAKCLPTVNSISHGEAVYGQWYSADRQKEKGVVCLGLELVNGSDRRGMTSPKRAG